MTETGKAIEAYFERLRFPGRTRFAPTREEAELQTDKKLPKVRFYRFKDGSHVRFDKGDVQEF